MLRLKCEAQNYAWGRPAATSEVASLYQANGGQVDQEATYAELWMGTHVNGPSTVQKTGEQLQTWLDKHPVALGAVINQHFGNCLPFLFKVLSIQSALSIQSHPDKNLAELLHAENPENYKDDNHKPEMAIALTEFEALCGFATDREIRMRLYYLPELAMFFGRAMDQLLDEYSDDGQGLRAAFSSLMRLERTKVHQIVSKIIGRLQHKEKHSPLIETEELMLRVAREYPNDVGVLAVPFLNKVQLKPGQAVYLPANEPHAYLSGDVVECMAASDNVIRVGLTRKHRDTEVLCASLNYRQGHPGILNGEEGDDIYTKVYRPPFNEFEVHHLTLPPNTVYTLEQHIGPTIALVHQGEAQQHSSDNFSHLPEIETQSSLKRGDVFFLPARTSSKISTGEQGVSIFIAMCNRAIFVGDPYIDTLEATVSGNKVTVSVQCA